MFDSIQPPRRRRPRIVFVLSIAAHAAGLTFLVLTGFWRIDKLGVETVPLAIAAPPAGLGAAADEPEARRPERPHATPRPDLPAKAERPHAEAPGEQTGTSAGTGSDGDPIGIGLTGCEGCQGSILDQQAEPPACGNGRVEAGEDCDDGNRTAGDGCSASCRVDQERIVVAHVIEGHRIEGDPQIAPPDTVKQAMARSGLDRLTGNVKMCLDKEGRVRSLRLLRSTGHAEYDQRLLAGMRTWRYHPYKLDSGAAVPVCTVVTFIYRAQ
jgi:TonB family protein